MALEDYFPSQMHLSFVRVLQGIAIWDEYDYEYDYDTTWMHGIYVFCWDATKPSTVHWIFLQQHTFRFRKGTVLSCPFSQQEKVLQDGVLRVTLLVLAINGMGREVFPGYLLHTLCGWILNSNAFPRLYSWASCPTSIRSGYGMDRFSQISILSHENFCLAIFTRERFLQLLLDVSLYAAEFQ